MTAPWENLWGMPKHNSDKKLPKYTSEKYVAQKYFSEIFCHEKYYANLGMLKYIFFPNFLVGQLHTGPR